MSVNQFAIVSRTLLTVGLLMLAFSTWTNTPINAQETSDIRLYLERLDGGRICTQCETRRPMTDDQESVEDSRDQVAIHIYNAGDTAVTATILTLTFETGPGLAEAHDFVKGSGQSGTVGGPPSNGPFNWFSLAINQPIVPLPDGTELPSIEGTHANGTDGQWVHLPWRVADDRTLEGDEEVRIRLDYTLSDGTTGSYTDSFILKDDDSATISVQHSAVTVAEGEGMLGTKIKAVITDAPGGSGPGNKPQKIQTPVSVSLTASDITAIANADYLVLTDSITLDSETGVETPIPIALVDDCESEPEESFTVTIAEPSTTSDAVVSLGADTVDVKITDFSQADGSRTETGVPIPIPPTATIEVYESSTVTYSVTFDRKVITGDVTLTMEINDTSVAIVEPTEIVLGPTQDEVVQNLEIKSVWDADDDDESAVISHTATCGLITSEPKTARVRVLDVGAPFAIGGEPTIYRIEPVITSVTQPPGEFVRLAVDVFGIQDIHDNGLADSASPEEVAFTWTEDGAVGPFFEHMKAEPRSNSLPDDREVLHQVSRTPGTYMVRSTLFHDRGCYGLQEGEELPIGAVVMPRCVAEFIINVRRAPDITPTQITPVNPSGAIPQVVTDTTGVAYSVFTPVEGGQFIGEAATISANPGAVPNGEIIGVNITPAGDASNIGDTYPRYTLSGHSYSIEVVDASGQPIPTYRLNTYAEACLPLPDEFRANISDVAVTVINDDDTLTILTTKVMLDAGGIMVCGRISSLPALVAVGVEGAPADLPEPDPIVRAIPPETGGVTPDATVIALVFVLGVAIAGIGVTLLSWTRRRRPRYDEY